MRRFLYALATALIGLIVACGSESGTQPQTERGDLEFQMSLAPAREMGLSVARVSADLVHLLQGDSVTVDLTISADSLSAAGTVHDLRSGNWEVVVSAYDSGGVFLASGRDTVVVTPGDVTTVDIVLRVSGAIQINVTWELEPDSIPSCGTVLLSEDFESCTVGAWIGACSGWLTWANGDSQSDFFITDQDQVSGTRALQVSGAGSCWEGSAYKSVTGTDHLLIQTMIKASGEGPSGCHCYQTGFDMNPALWSFDMPCGENPGGLRCRVSGGGSFTAIEGFENAVGRWYAVATELDYETGQARFWLDGQLVWSSPFDTAVRFNQVWLRSGEGLGWFDDVLVCSI